MQNGLHNSRIRDESCPNFPQKQDRGRDHAENSPDRHVESLASRLLRTVPRHGATFLRLRAPPARGSFARRAEIAMRLVRVMKTTRNHRHTKRTSPAEAAVDELLATYW